MKRLRLCILLMLAIPVFGPVQSVNGQEHHTNEINKSSGELKEDGKEQLIESATKIENIDTIINNAKSLAEDISEGSSYVLISKTKEILKKYLSVLNTTSGSENAEQINYVRNYIQKVINHLSAIPDIDSELINSLNKIDKSCQSCINDIEQCFEQYKTIDSDSDEETKNNFIEKADKALSKSDNLNELFKKIDKMFSKMEKDFEKSPLKTSDYFETVKLWEKILPDTANLDSKAIELDKCIFKLKTPIVSDSSEE